jgi:DNA-binding NarL/FixJ family response regulator
MNSSQLIHESTWSALQERGATDAPTRAVRLIERIASAADDAAVLDLLHEAATELGADQAVFVSFIRDDDSRESFRFLVAADPAWCLAYQERAWFTNDAWLLHAATTSEPATDAAITYRTKEQREARALAAQFGVTSAYIVPAPASGGLSRLGVLMLGSAQPHFFDGPRAGFIKVLARSLAMELHDWWVRQVRSELIAETRITDTDLQLLQRERQGKLTKEIAHEMGLSEASVNNRFQRLNVKFNAPSRRVAARMAAEYGLI